MTVHSPVCVVRTSHVVYSTFQPSKAVLRAVHAVLNLRRSTNDYSVTVTCRQFPNLTFAPRKTCLIPAATSRFNAINVTAFSVYLRKAHFSSPFLQFLYFFSYKPSAGNTSKMRAHQHYCILPKKLKKTLTFSCDNDKLIISEMINRGIVFEEAILIYSKRSGGRNLCY